MEVIAQRQWERNWDSPQREAYLRAQDERRRARERLVYPHQLKAELDPEEEQEEDTPYETVAISVARTA